MLYTNVLFLFEGSYEEINIENVFIPHITEKKVDVKHLSILHYIDLKYGFHKINSAKNDPTITSNALVLRDKVVMCSL